MFKKEVKAAIPAVNQLRMRRLYYKLSPKLFIFPSCILTKTAATVNKIYRQREDTLLHKHNFYYKDQVKTTTAPFQKKKKKTTTAHTKPNNQYEYTIILPK